MNTSAIILAAGQSKRMGSINKLLIDIDGIPMVRRTVEQYINAGIKQVIVVVGHQQEKVCSALQGLEIEILLNTAFAQGQVTSIRRGLAALSNQTDVVLIGLSDQPLITTKDISQLLTVFQQQSIENPEKSMLVPYQNDLRGNPIVLTTKQALVVDQDGVHLGCRKLTDKYPEKVVHFKVKHDHFHTDIDTPKQVSALLGKQAMKEMSIQ